MKEQMSDDLAWRIGQFLRVFRFVPLGGALF